MSSIPNPPWSLRTLRGRTADAPESAECAQCAECELCGSTELTLDEVTLHEPAPSEIAEAGARLLLGECQSAGALRQDFGQPVLRGPVGHGLEQRRPVHRGSRLLLLRGFRF